MLTGLVPLFSQMQRYEVDVVRPPVGIRHTSVPMLPWYLEANY